MRYIILAILIYILYLFFRFLIKLYANSSGKDAGVKGQTGRKKHSKIDVDKIEEADYEEIKNSDKQK